MSFFDSLNLPILLVVGVVTGVSFYLSKAMKYVRLPSISGFMLVGALLGPSLLNLLDGETQETLSFLPEIALGFVAVSIGLELRFSTLKQLGAGIIAIILLESFAALFVVAGGIYLLTGNLPLAVLFGAIAPASAPAGTVAVIEEYRAKGNLTNTLYAVVGFDDGLGIIIFGFASAVASRALVGDAGGGFWSGLVPPLVEVAGSIGLGLAMAVLFALLVRKTRKPSDALILTFAMVLTATGLSVRFGLSLILVNLVLGMALVNLQPASVIKRVRDVLGDVMPLLFVLFFTLAGANLHFAALPALGLIGPVYILGRSTGKMGGAWLGCLVGRAEKTVRNNLGLGILSQAGVAIGLALIVKQEYAGLGPAGVEIGRLIITSVTATSIIFEIIGPIATKIALRNAGEINVDDRDGGG
jgi:Kef-type K+ transport system membrane component KefB